MAWLIHQINPELKKLIVSKNKLRKVLMFFKVDKITNITEIKYISRLLRGKLRKEELPDVFNHNDSIIRNIAKITSKQIKQSCLLAVKMIVRNIS